MDRFRYESSIAYRRHLIVPWVFSRVNERTLYSYSLLSEFGHQGQFHQTENPANLYSTQVERLIEAAKQHLDRHGDPLAIPDFKGDYFQQRYTYRGNLIIVHEAAGKYFYDHYAPHRLQNIAAPKMFPSATACIQWVKDGLDRNAGTPRSRHQPFDGNKSRGK